MWLQKVDIKFDRGILLTLILFFIPPLFLKGSLYFGINPKSTALIDILILVGVFSLEVPIVLLLISRIGKIDIKQLLFGKLPTWKEYLAWGIIASALGFLNFILHLRYGYRLEEDGYALITAEIYLQSVVFPIIEESTYRGICFVALYNYNHKNKVLAYLGSTFLFLIAHSPSFSELIQHATLGLHNIHILFIICFSFLTAYIYHSTGKLVLCIWVHGIVNGMEYVGILTGYLGGVAPPH